MEKDHARSCDHVRDLLARICPYRSDLRASLTRTGAFLLQAQLFRASILAVECLEGKTMEGLARW